MNDDYKPPKRLNDFPLELRGPAQNRYNGHQTQRLRGWGKVGKANDGRSLSHDEIEEWKKQHNLIAANDNRASGYLHKTILWHQINFGKYAVRTLPEIISEDPSYFYWGLKNRKFKAQLKVEADELAWRAKNIKIPNCRPFNSPVIAYRFRRNYFQEFLIVEKSASAHYPSVKFDYSKIDFSILSRLRKDDKYGGTKFVACFKSIYFGDLSIFLSRVACCEFFNDPSNFNYSKEERNYYE